MAVAMIVMAVVMRGMGIVMVVIMMMRVAMIMAAAAIRSVLMHGLFAAR